jgi:hypothetical protein
MFAAKAKSVEMNAKRLIATNIRTVFFIKPAVL